VEIHSLNLFSIALIADGALCVASLAAMAYWTGKAEPSPEACEECGQVHAVYDIALPTLPDVESWRYELVKRMIDMILSSFMLVILLIPACLVGLLIRLTSRGPIFYREERIGRYGDAFRIWKFRSMYANAESKSKAQRRSDETNSDYWRMLKSMDDPRITRVGRFLRRWSLDEIPQLLNILLGHMSLVGPRPIVEAELGVYGGLIDEYIKVTPGLSGLWQVSGRSNIGYAKRAKLDAYYVKKWGLKSDFQILLRTVPVVLRRIGAK
jgi:lipopolysaccharide/colanic/teichoic acid biosynthesis glycosyltransferase